MRDFNVGGNIRGGHDVHINIQSNQPNSLDQCTNEELRAERQRRKQGIANERNRKIKICSVLCGLAEVAIFIVAVVFHLKGNTNTSTLIFALGSTFAGVVSLQYVFGKNEVQQVHTDKIRKIDLTLRERGAQ
jgi:hypothetical protein